MSPLSCPADAVFRLSGRIEVLPILHGSGDMAQEVRETLIARRYDCVALPLPPSVEELVERGIDRLPQLSVVVLPEPHETPSLSPDNSEELERHSTVSFVPIDPCQAVIMGARVAIGEEITRAYIDREVHCFKALPLPAPDPYALKQVSCAAFAAAMVGTLPSPQPGSQQFDRINWMAFRLHELELQFASILYLCPLSDWPWVRQAYRDRQPYAPPEAATGSARLYRVSPETLYFMLGELPYVTELYERRRAEVRSDRHLAVDGIKELLIETRSRWLAGRESETKSLPNWVTPHLLQLYLQYVRNLALLEHRLTPDLYTLVQSAKQMAGDEFAIMLLETAKSYAFQDLQDSLESTVSAGIAKLELPDGSLVAAKNRLQGAPQQWRSLSLKPRPTPLKSRRWALQWNPYRQCSWPPEDNRIESFTQHVREQARAILGADLARVEKFTTSVKDGVDLRETLRHWAGSFRPGQSPAGLRSGVAPAGQPAGTVSHRMEIYIKEIPPARGNVEAVVFLFDTPADPDRFRWRATWYAEHDQESTLCFYATPFQDQIIGPGIAQSLYGGAFFLFPPRHIPNIWEDQRLDVAGTLEERLIAAAALHSQERHIVVVSPIPPSARWRRIARDFHRQLVPMPLTRFSGQTIDRLRRFHVLNGHEIRSYATRFIRDEP